MGNTSKVNMDSNQTNQITQIEKVFLAPFLLVISLVIIFISTHFIKSEYNEYFKYGQITTGQVTNTYWESSGDSPPTSLFYCKINVGQKKYTYEIQNADQSFMLSDEEAFLISEIKKGDLVKIKILNEKTATILEWKKNTINPVYNLSSIFGMWLIIFILLSMAGFLLYKIYNIYKK